MSTRAADQANIKWAGLADAWELAKKAIDTCTRMLIVGPPGVGKSYAAVRAGDTYYQVTLSEDLTWQELMGHYVPKGTVFVWHDGPVAQAMREGAILVLNEVGRASSAVLDGLLGVLDDPEVCCVSLPTGENLKPAKGFRVIATSNSGPETLDVALQDRFEVMVSLAVPNPALIKRLNSAKAGLGDAIANSYASGESAISPRRALSFVAFMKAGHNAKVAAVMAFGAKASDFLNALTASGVTV